MTVTTVFPLGVCDGFELGLGVCITTCVIVSCWSSSSFCFSGDDAGLGEGVWLSTTVTVAVTVVSCCVLVLDPVIVTVTILVDVEPSVPAEPVGVAVSTYWAGQLPHVAHAATHCCGPFPYEASHGTHVKQGIVSLHCRPVPHTFSTDLCRRHQ